MVCYYAESAKVAFHGQDRQDRHARLGGVLARAYGVAQRLIDILPGGLDFDGQPPEYGILPDYPCPQPHDLLCLTAVRRTARLNSWKSSTCWLQPLSQRFDD